MREVQLVKICTVNTVNPTRWTFKPVMSVEGSVASQAVAALKIFIQLRCSNGLMDTLKDEQRMVY